MTRRNCRITSSWPALAKAHNAVPTGHPTRRAWDEADGFVKVAARERAHAYRHEDGTEHGMCALCGLDETAPPHATRPRCA